MSVPAPAPAPAVNAPQAATYSYDPYAGTQSYGTQSYYNPSVFASTVQQPNYQAAAYPVSFAPAPAAAPVQGFAPGQQFIVQQAAPLIISQDQVIPESRVDKLGRLLLVTLKLFDKELKRDIKIVKFKKASKTVKIPTIQQILINGTQQLVLQEKETTRQEIEFEEKSQTSKETRQLITGEYVSVEVVTKSQKPKIELEEFFTVSGVPEGVNVLEYTSDEGTPLSPEFIEALKKTGGAQVKEKLEKAEYVVWGAKLF